MNHAAVSHTGEKRFAISDEDRSVSSSKKSKQSAAASNIPVVPTANLDADDPWEEDYTEEDLKASNSPVNSGSDEDDSGEEDEEALLAELAKIKRERAEEAIQVAAEKKAAEETIRMENILKGNPLMNNSSSAGSLILSFTLSFMDFNV